MPFFGRSLEAYLANATHFKGEYARKLFACCFGGLAHMHAQGVAASISTFPSCFVYAFTLTPQASFAKTCLFCAVSWQIKVWRTMTYGQGRS